MPLPSFEEIFDRFDESLFPPIEAAKKQAKADPALKIMLEVNAHIDRTGSHPSIDTTDPGEKSLARRWAAILEQEKISDAMREADQHGILPDATSDEDEMSYEDLLASDLLDGEDDLYELKHVKQAPKAMPETIAQRRPCADFEAFRKVFEQIQDDIDAGERNVRRFAGEGEIRQGDAFILNGLMVYVAEVGKYTKREGRRNARARLIYSNGMESESLVLSLARLLYDDQSGRRISRLDALPLMDRVDENAPQPTGYVYVVASLSSDPEVAKHRGLLHKIGVTRKTTRERIRSSLHANTFLKAPVEIVATYPYHGSEPELLEKLLHNVFHAAQAQIEIPDGKGGVAKPKEWFLVPAHAVSKAVELLRDGTLDQVRYDVATGRFAPR